MRAFAAILSLLVLIAGVFFVYQYFNVRLGLVAVDPTYATGVVPELLQYLLFAGIAIVVLVALLIYSTLTMRSAARRIAYQISKDISLTKEQFRRFYELSPVPYLLINKHGQMQRPNKAFLRLVGVAEDELRKKDIFTLLSVPDNPEKLAMYREQARRHVAIEQKEVQITRVSGEHRWVLLSIEDLASPGGGEHLSLVTMVDIHEQKELERIKTEFLSLASHQLRAPLANLKWYIDFLLTRRADDINEEVTGYLHKMYQRNEDMIDLVNTLLNMSRVEMGRVKVQKEDTDVITLTKSVIEELAPAAAGKELHIVQETDEALTFNTDGRLMRIVLQNLLSNAIRYTNTGGTVTVRVHGSGSKLTLEVQDTGVGIPPEEQGKIFAKLYRASNAQAMEANGNGIGLYMCKALVEGMGGTISFNSVIGKGTTFTVELVT